MNDFLDTATALAAGLWWLWAFLFVLLVASLAITGGLVLLDLVDRAYDRWQVRRGRVRVLNPETGREEWVPVHPDAHVAIDVGLVEIRNRREVRRG